jgi:pimeloyl-ACP methyl ester carboxylesterase
MHNFARRVVQTIISLMLLVLGSSAWAMESAESSHQVSIPGNTAWIDTGLSLSIGDRVSVSASGTISIGCDSCPDQQTPDGRKIRKVSGDDRPFIAPGLFLWSLVGKVGSSRPFELGSDHTFVSTSNGKLKLSINDNSFDDNSGHWTATVKITRASPQLFVLSPFRLKAPDLTNLDLAVLLPGLGDFTSARAVGVVADSASTAITLWETSTRSAVTFSTDNGTSLASYQSDFLTKAPVAGAQTLTVPGSDLIKIGAKFYAAALVQAPARDAARSLDEPAVITAAQKGAPVSSGKAFLSLNIPPVLLVHGLWGDKKSLIDTYHYLAKHSPWEDDARLLTRIEYPKNLRFDAGTISATVADAVESLLATLNSKRVVGGRVDVVGHSMGGLVVRHYSSLPLYRAPRDRGQGQFHALTTLDTPELGSTLARFLIRHRNEHAQAPTVSEPSIVYLAVCGSLSATVAECFDDNEMPIFGPDDSVVRGGAVWSLVPSSISLDQAPSLPSIAGLLWADITSVARDKDDSTLRFVISNLIAAIFEDPDSAPTPTDILGGANDVIVSLKSQANGSTQANRIKFLGLDHTVLRFAGFQLNKAVNNSDKVNGYVACWFEKEGDASCIPAGPVQGEVERVAEQGPLVVPKVVDQLVQVPQNAAVGVPLEVTGSVNAKGVRQVAVYQKNDAGKTAPDTEQAIPFSVSGNQLRFDIIPQLPGRVTFEIQVTLSDGSRLVQRVVRKVSVREDMLRELHGHASDQVFLFTQIGAGLPLAPFGIFRNVEEEVPLDGQVEYSIVSGDSPPVVRIDGDTLVPLRPGTARVEAHLDSKTDLLTVTVKP